jgi:NADH:ubiquinone oxidoreductase subunit 6 (subunit J)
LQAAFSVSEWKGPKTIAEQQTIVGTQSPAAPTAATLGLGFMGVRVDKLEQTNQVLRNGMSGYLLAFEIISIHLVVVMVGAAYLARSKRAMDPEQTKLQAAEMSHWMNGPS